MTEHASMTVLNFITGEQRDICIGYAFREAAGDTRRVVSLVPVTM